LEVHRDSGAVASDPQRPRHYLCPLLDCSVWVYVSNPAVPGRTIRIDVPSAHILPPHTVLASEREIASGTFVKIYEAKLDASRLQMASFTIVTVNMTETSPTWGAHVEEMEVQFDL
jgi:hypothetical protein